MLCVTFVIDKAAEAEKKGNNLSSDISHVKETLTSEEPSNVELQALSLPHPIVLPTTLRNNGNLNPPPLPHALPPTPHQPTHQKILPLTPLLAPQFLLNTNTIRNLQPSSKGTFAPPPSSFASPIKLTI